MKDYTAYAHFLHGRQDREKIEQLVDLCVSMKIPDLRENKHVNKLLLVKALREQFDFAKQCTLYECKIAVEAFMLTM